MDNSEISINEKPDKKFEQLFEHCFEIDRIEDGDLIPVGGENRFSQETTDIKVIADFENLQGWFEEMQKRKDKIIGVESVMSWAESKGLDRNVFASAAAFTKTLGEVYSKSQKPELSRQNLYRQRGEDIKLSDVFNSGVAECAEITALAQYELQQQGIKSSYFSGDVLWNKDEEDSEEHSFIVIKQGDKTFIFDPANPADTRDGKFPSIYAVEANFDLEVRKGRKRFVTAKNIFNGAHAFFGVNDRTNVSEKDIVE